MYRVTSIRVIMFSISRSSLHSTISFIAFSILLNGLKMSTLLAAKPIFFSLHLVVYKRKYNFTMNELQKHIHRVSFLSHFCRMLAIQTKAKSVQTKFSVEFILKACTKEMRTGLHAHANRSFKKKRIQKYEMRKEMTSILIDNLLRSARCDIAVAVMLLLCIINTR